MGAVEDADVARLRQRVADPPQEAVLALLGGRRLEAGDLHALRVDQPDGVAQHAALARGVHPLQHQQHPALASRWCARPTAAPAGRTARHRARTGRPCPCVLPPSKPGVCVGRDRAEVDGTGREPVEVGGHGLIMSSNGGQRHPARGVSGQGVSRPSRAPRPPPRRTVSSVVLRRRLRIAQMSGSRCRREPSAMTRHSKQRIELIRDGAGSEGPEDAVQAAQVAPELGRGEAGVGRGVASAARPRTSRGRTPRSPRRSR